MLAVASCLFLSLGPISNKVADDRRLTHLVRETSSVSILTIALRDGHVFKIESWWGGPEDFVIIC